jgi:hypothetical protein
MPLDFTASRQRLKAFEFTPLFLEDLGWDHAQHTFTVEIDDRSFRLTALAKKCGMVAYACSAADGTAFPDRSLRLRLDREVTQTTYEHLLVFTDARQTLQVWQWVRRESGRPIACREHTYQVSQPGDSLLQKLQQLAVSLEDEERGLALPEITGRVRAAFDVERITKRFYDQFRKEKDVFTKFIEGIPVAEDRHWYASVMLNRLMFVYFIQRKGFLDGDPDYLRHKLEQSQREHGQDKFFTFYRHFLLRLFHEGLGQRPPRKAGLDKLLGRIPYLNGGIFDVHQLEAQYGGDLQIPDTAFERIFSYFDEWAWHLDERPLQNDNEINPAVLGFIFEKYVNQKQMGAYYTQEDITEYISKSTIIPNLFDAARARCKVAFDNPSGPTVWDLLKTDPDRYLYPAVRHGMDKPLPPEIAIGLDTTKPRLLERRQAWNKPAPPEFGLPTEIWREAVARRQHCEAVRKKLAAGEIRGINDFITLNLDLRQFAQDVIQNCEGPDLLMAFWQAVVTITVLDPTGGSGAFLFAALNILEPLYEACLDRMEAFLAEWGEAGKKLHPNYHKKFTEVLTRVDAHPNRRYFVLKSIILNNLYAVDIMEEAVEICKLRLFLKLAAQVEPDAAKDNLGIEPLPDIDFNIRAGNTLVGYATADEVRKSMTEFGSGQMRLGVEDELNSFVRFTDKLQIADAAFRSFRRQQTELGGLVTAQDKADLKAKLKSLEDELNRYLAGNYGVKLGDKVAYKKWLTDHQPFHWFIEFYGILASGGFAVVIGNPPYVVNTPEKVAYAIKGSLLKTHSTKNLYAMVYERSLQLARKDASLGMIVQLTALSSEKMSPLQDLLLERGFLFAPSFPRRPESIFDGVEMPVAILISQPGGTTIGTTRISRFYTEERSHALSVLRLQSHTTRLAGHRIAKFGTPTEVNIFQKLDSSKSVLSSLASADSEHLLYYQEACRYWAKSCKGYPFFKRNGERMAPPHGRTLAFRNANASAFAMCLLNSSLFYWFYSAFSDCEHINDALIQAFKIPASWEKEDWTALEGQLARSLKKSAERKVITTQQGHKIEYDELDASKSKPQIDEVDFALARHYGFTDEELDFILNYDIKYRLGRDTEGEEE